MTDTLDSPAGAHQPLRPGAGWLALRTLLRVGTAVAVLVVVAVGGYRINELHADRAEASARNQAAASSDRADVILRAGRHTVYAPAGWGAEEYPSVRYRRIVSYGTYGSITVHLSQASVRDMGVSQSRPRTMRSLATPSSLCRFTARDLAARPGLGAQVRSMRCTTVRGGRARIRVLPDSPHRGAAKVRVAVALPEKGRYLNLWTIDRRGSIAKAPRVWAAGFVKNLEAYDVTRYSVETIYAARGASGRYGEG